MVTMAKRKSPSSSGVLTVAVNDHLYDVFHYPWTTMEMSSSRVYQTVEISIQYPIAPFKVIFVVHRGPVLVEYYHADHVVEMEGRQIRIPEDSPVYPTLKELLREECSGIPHDIAEEMEAAWEAASA
jgi:hypothetical protein